MLLREFADHKRGGVVGGEAILLQRRHKTIGYIHCFSGAFLLGETKALKSFSASRRAGHAILLASYCSSSCQGRQPRHNIIQSTRQHETTRNTNLVGEHS